MTAGRKPLYNPEALELGQKMEMKGKAKKFVHQYLSAFNKRNSNKKYRYAPEGNKIFIERIK